MSLYKNRTLQNVETFIRWKLPAKLRRDLGQLRIVKEGDLECATYYHLRRFVGEDPKWRGFARLHVSRTGHYIDLLIFRKKCPTIALELKWDQARIGDKDRRSLNAALKKLGGNQAYLLCVLPSSKKRLKGPWKKLGEKRVLHRVMVRLEPGTDFEQWKKRRQDYRSKMGL